MQALTINGTNFLSSSTVAYNSVAHTATFVSSTQLTISLSASDQATAGSYAVVVTNPSPGGGASNSVNFAVNNPVPAITSLSPSSATAGATAQTLTINGTNFLSASTVTYNGAAHAATFGSSTMLTISLSASDQATAGSYPVVVTNPSPGGGASNAVNFTVNGPTISSVLVSCNPASIAETQNSQCTTTVSGTGDYSSAVTWSVTAGTISTAGLFTAPSSSGTVTVTAKSAQDSTKNGTTTITVTTWTSYNNSQLQIEVGIPPLGQPTQCVLTNPANGQTKVRFKSWIQHRSSFSRSSNC